LIRFVYQIGDDSGKFCGDIKSFGWILLQIEEQRWIMLATALAAKLDLRDEMCLPCALADRRQLLVDVVVVDVPFAWTRAEHNRQQAFAINGPVVGDLCISQFQARRKKVHRGGQFGGHLSRLDFTRPPGDAWLAHSAFPGAAFALPQESGGAAVQSSA